MRKHILAAFMAVAVFALTVGVASSALAVPSYGKCSGCHDVNAAVTVKADAGTASAATTQYTITVANSLGTVGWAVYNGSTKVQSGLGAGTTIALTNGVTYTVFGAGLDGANTIGNSTLVTPIAPAPVPDITAPTTISDVKAAYLGSASIKLTATDNLGGSGVAHTYLILDGGSQIETTTLSTSVLGTHTVEFWSVDASSNAETPHNTAEFTVSAKPAPPVATKYNYTYKFNLKKKVYKKLRATLKSNATGKKYTVTVSKKGVATWKSLPKGKYRLSTTGNLRFKFKARTVKVGP